jgi:hypothetical protein
LLVIPFVIPGAATLNPGATSGFNLNFTATSGSASAAFSFIITVKADNVPSFSTTINVPGAPDTAAPPKVAITPLTQTTTTRLVRIDASGSSDPNGLPLKFNWTVVGTPSATLIHSDSAVLDVQCDSGFGIYTFQVKVTNSAGISSTGIATVQFIGR